MVILTTTTQAEPAPVMRKGETAHQTQGREDKPVRSFTIPITFTSWKQWRAAAVEGAISGQGVGEEIREGTVAVACSGQVQVPVERAVRAETGVTTTAFMPHQVRITPPTRLQLELPASVRPVGTEAMLLRQVPPLAAAVPEGKAEAVVARMAMSLLPEPLLLRPTIATRITLL